MWGPNADPFRSAARAEASKEDVALDGGVHPQSLDGEVPLPGAEVRAYRLGEYADDPGGAAPVGSATTDDEGRYEVDDVPEDADLIVVVGTEPRLTTVVPGVAADSDGDVSTATTLAVERWGPELREGAPLPEGEPEATIQQAEAILEGASAEELADVLESLVPATFGQGFPEDDHIPPFARFVADVLAGADPQLCEGLELEADAATPTSEIEVHGLVEDFGQEPRAWLYDAEVESPGEEARQPVFIQRIDGERGELVVPVHPADWMGGGEAEISVVEEEDALTCPGLELEVESLEPSPITMEDVVDEIENALVQRAEALGYEESELRTANAWELPSYVSPIAAALQGIDGAGFENDLRSLITGDAPLFGDDPMDAEAREVMEALMRESGFTEGILGVAEEISELSEASASLQSVQSALASTARQGADMDLGIESPFELDFWMDAQERCAKANGGVAQGARVGGGLVIAGAAFLVPGAQGVAGVATLNLFLFEVLLEVCEKHFPSELTELRVDPGPPTVYDEDGDERGPWEATLEAAGQGFTLSWPTALGAVPGAGKIGEIVGGFRGAGEFGGEVADFVGSFMTEAWDMTEDSGPINWPAETFTVDVDPTRANESTYFLWELDKQWSDPAGKEPFLFVNQDTEYVPNAAGVSLLRVRTQGGEVFQGQVASGEEPLRVEPIEITIESEGGRSPFVVDPEEEIDLFAQVENAEDKSVEWYADQGFFIDIRGEFDQEATYAAPEEEGTYTVEVESTAETGARSDGEPPRTGLATVIVGGLEISPDPICVELEEEVEFTAVLGTEEISFDDPDLDWTITGPGSLGTDGVFVPMGEGEVSIEFEYAPEDASEPFTDEVNFTVREICTYMRVSSSRFAHSTECAFAQTPDPTLDEAPVIYFLNNTIGEPIRITFAASETLPLEGEWEEVILDWGGTVFSPEDEEAFEAVVPEDPDPLPLKREELESDGETVGLYSASFETVFRYQDETTEEQIDILVEGEFSGLWLPTEAAAVPDMEDLPEACPDDLEL